MREFKKNKFRKTLKIRQKGGEPSSDSGSSASFGSSFSFGFGKAKSEDEIAKQKKINEEYSATLKKYINIFEMSEAKVNFVLKFISLELLTGLIQEIKDQAAIMKYTTIPSNKEQLTEIIKEALKKFLKNTKNKTMSAAGMALRTAGMTETTLLTEDRVKNIFKEEPEEGSNLVVQFITDLEILKRGTNINKTLPETYEFPLTPINNGVASELYDDKDDDGDNIGASVSSELPSKNLSHIGGLIADLRRIAKIAERETSCNKPTEPAGGSKKRRISKRHTKRHKRNNKKRYTKKRR
jgi:hypothetical protein